MRKIDRFLKYIILFIMFMLITFITITNLHYNYFHYATKKWLFEENLEILLSGILFFIISILLLYYLLKKFEILKNKKAIWLVSLILLVFQIIYIYSYYNVVGYDILKVLNNSYSLAYTGNLVEADKWYFQAWPNNIFILNLYTVIIKLFTFIGLYNYIDFILIIINCIVSISVGLLLFKILNRLFNNITISWLGYLFYLLLVILSPHISVIYTDALGILFPILTLYFYLKYKDENRNLYLTLIAIIGTLSYSIKPHTSIIFIAIIIYEFIFLSYTYKHKLKLLFVILFTSIITFNLISIQTNYIKKQLDLERRVGYLHYIKMGLNSDWIGLYSHEDFAESYKIENKEERDNRNIEIIKERISNHNLYTYKEFIIKKTLINYNDGTFGWYFISENNKDDIIKKDNNILSNFTNNIYIYDSKYYNKFFYIHQMYWLVVLLLIFISILNFKNYSDNIKYILFITFIGVFLMVSIFEASARYLFTNVPIFIICSMYGLQNLIEFKNRIIYKIKN